MVSSSTGLLLTLVVVASVATITEAKRKLNNDSRIMGGQPAGRDQIPFQVYLRIYDGEEWYICGGSIITINWVLSAAHCFCDDSYDYPAEVTARTILGYAGIIDTTEINGPNVQPFSLQGNQIATNLHIHPDYRYQYRENNDIALIQRDGEFNFVPDNVDKVLLAPPDFIVEGNFAASGWGDISSNGDTSTRLMFAYLNPYAWNLCHAYFNGGISENMLCTRTETATTCEGDSGGPLFTGVNNVLIQVGITSYGPNPCRLNTPEVATDVRRFHRYIIEVVYGTCRGGNKRCLRKKANCSCSKGNVSDECKAACSCESNCPDKSDKCPMMAAKGKCRRVKTFNKCKASCACDNCRDLWEDSKCKELADSGLCTKAGHKLTMAINCKKTCDKCEKCVDKSEKCPKFAADGKCSKKKVLKKCKKSCTEFGFPTFADI